ncbi:MAG: GNAT family N-acetyltransferase [Firmicutes bacterium]|nr:GNAT family N-acetyltransferase [Bacillota bacterium]
MLRFKMERTDEYELLIPFFIENGLEFDEDEKKAEGAVQAWKVTQGDHLVAGCSLVLREGHFVIEGIAVEKTFRKFGIGKILIDKALEEVRARGGKELLLMARKPAFYEKLHFTEVSPEDAPPIFDCLGCPQYGVDCFPKIMKYVLPETEPEA